MRRSDIAPILVVAAVACAGCDDEVDIIGECTLGEMKRVTEEPLLPSVGLLDGRVLLSVSYDVPAEYLTLRRSEWQGLWLDQELEPASEPLWLGSGLIGAARARWLRHDGALVAHTWSRPEPPPPWSEDTISLWTVTPPPDARAEALPIEIDIPPAPEDNPGVNGLGLGVLHQPGAETALPGAASPAGVAGVVAAIPPECGERLATYYRLHWFSGMQPQAEPIQWGDDRCELYDYDRAVESPWLFEGLDGRPSILFRGGADGRVHLLRLNEDFTIRDGPRRVGGTHVTTTDDGFQPRAVSVPGGRVLFFERISGGNDCHMLRIMNADGTCVEDTPWQLPCMSVGRYRADRPIVTGYLELVAVPGGAVVVWGEHTNPGSLRITSDIDYREGIYAALLTPEGRRGSAIVEITDDAATFLEPVPRTEILGPFPVKPRPSVAVEDDALVVAWPDRREHAPGVYVRKLTCTVDGH